jgi:hypothetical protein
MTERSDDERPLAEARTAVHEVINDDTERITAVAAIESRRWFSRSVLAAGLVAVIVTACFSVAALIIAGRADNRVDQQDVKFETLREIAEQAKLQGEQANAALERRGQEPVPIPQPGDADDSDVLVAAAAAQVLEMLPDTSVTEAEVAAAIVKVAAGNRALFAPSPQQIAAEVAGYFVLNPPPAGLTGPSGSPGRDGADGRDGEDAPPPTAEELQAAVDAHIRDNPNALCPEGGQRAQLTLRLADGGTADTWACVVQVQPSPTTPSTDPPLLPPPRR